MKRTQIYLPEDLHEAVRRMAFEQRRSMADLIREAVTSYVAEQDDESACITVETTMTLPSDRIVPV